jgi:hypothetical protein
MEQVQHRTIPHKLARQSRLQEFLGQLDLDEHTVKNCDYKFEKIERLNNMIRKIERFELSIPTKTIQDDYTLATRKSLYKERVKQILISQA